MSSTDKKEIIEEIFRLKSVAEAALNEAICLSDEHGVGFRWDYEYGMGGYYEPVPEGADGDEIDSWGDRKYGWMPSSQGC